MTSLGDMPLLNDYSLCRQAVTVYRYGDGAVTRTVHPRAYLERRKSEAVDKAGGRESNGFLLVVPGSAQAVHVGDKVYEGEGPAVPAEGVDAWWRSFIPSKVDGLVVVGHVEVRRWDGGICHTEAGE